MRPGAILTDRDHELLLSLAECRFLTAAQVQRLHFPSTVTTLRRLRRLEEAGLLDRLRSAGSAAQLITLTPLGTESVLSRTADIPGLSLLRRRRRSPRPLFVEHAAAVNDFRIALKLSLRRHPDIELVSFVIDADRAYRGPGRQPASALAAMVTPSGGEEPIRHTPDVAFVLRRGAQSALFFVEIDRGSETVSHPDRGVGKLVRFYLHLLANSGSNGSSARPAPETELRSARLLLVTTSNRRVANIRERCGGRPFRPAIVKRFIWLAPAEVIQSSDLLRTHWTSLDPADDEQYLIARDGGGEGESR